MRSGDSAKDMSYCHYFRRKWNLLPQDVYVTSLSLLFSGVGGSKNMFHQFRLITNHGLILTSALINQGCVPISCEIKCTSWTWYVARQGDTKQPNDAFCLSQHSFWCCPTLCWLFLPVDPRSADDLRLLSTVTSGSLLWAVTATSRFSIKELWFGLLSHACVILHWSTGKFFCQQQKVVKQLTNV